MQIDLTYKRWRKSLAHVSKTAYATARYQNSLWLMLWGWEGLDLNLIVFITKHAHIPFHTTTQVRPNNRVQGNSQITGTEKHHCDTNSPLFLRTIVSGLFHGTLHLEGPHLLSVVCCCIPLLITVPKLVSWYSPWFPTSISGNLVLYVCFPTGSHMGPFHYSPPHLKCHRLRNT